MSNLSNQLLSIALILGLVACSKATESDPERPAGTSPATQPQPEAPDTPEPADGGSQPATPPSPSVADGSVEQRDEFAYLQEIYDGDPRLEQFDPADLRVIDGEKRMIAAERALARRIEAGDIESGARHLQQTDLEDWDYDDGLAGMPDAIRALDGTRVMMLGFIYPVDETRGMTEWMLVPSLWACCYGSPPDIHGAARVEMPKGQTLDHHYDPVRVVGTLRVSATVLNGYCVDVFQLHPESIQRLE